MKEITFKPLPELIKGIDILADAVSSTLGPKGNNVILQNQYQKPHVTKDGVTVAESIELENVTQNLGVQIVKEAAAKTDHLAGDGPQPLYAKVLTPNGFTTMKELKVGDLICGTNGTTQTVEGIFPKGEKEIYKVYFSDGRVVECCEDHLWKVTTSYGATKTLPLKEILNSNKVKSFNKDGSIRYGYYVPKTHVDFPKKDLPIDPYLLGLLIGDGSLSGTGNIELSLGKNKLFVLKNIPENIKFKSSWVDDKNYFRVVLDSEIQKPLEQLGLLGTLSSTKFIPKEYLYSSQEQREQLLQGLIDTDGYINNRDLFEYSTVSEQLKDDFLELCRGLGISTYDVLHTRENDPNSYSNIPIYRINQLKGYKYGDKIIDIEATGIKTMMQCIKVSNEDHLYITDNYIVTHNTTTSTVLARAIVKEGHKLIQAGVPAIEIKRQIEEILPDIIDFIKERSIEVKDNYKLIKEVATISSNNDPIIGSLIAEAMEKATADGIVAVKESKGNDTFIEEVNGLQFNKGYLSHYFMTDSEKQVAEHEDTYILITDQKIRDQSKILSAVEAVYKKNGSLLIIADEVEAQALAFLVRNKLSTGLKVVAVKAPGYGDRRRELLEDLAIVTGATVISEKNEHLRLEDTKLEHLGFAKSVTVTKDTTTIVEGNSDQSKLQKRIKQLKAQLASEEKEYEKERIQERLAKLVGGVVVLNIGAHTESELKEKKDRINDALRATKAAMKEGIVPGGGLVLYNAATMINGRPSNYGTRVLVEALQSPMKAIVENAGANFGYIKSELAHGDESVFSYGYNAFGYNALNDKFEDLIKSGIVDPAMVTRVALENAVSVANLVLMTNCTVAATGHEEYPPMMQ